MTLEVATPGVPPVLEAPQTSGAAGRVASPAALFPRVLDACCGSRMMWFDRHHPDALFADVRKTTQTYFDKSSKTTGGVRTLCVDPDVQMDFRQMPFPDASFKLVVFDPPHLVRAGPKSWMALKYGKLGAAWQDDLRQGFSECFRVLEPAGVLVFKWNEVHVKLSEILRLTPQQPLFGNTSGRKAGTHWMLFLAP